MAETTLLAELDDLATLTGRPDNDPRLRLALKRASARFIGDVGHPVVHIENDTIRLNGTGTRTLLLPAAPVTHITRVALANPFDAEELTDYELDPNAGILRRPGTWPEGLGNIEVTYAHGHREIPGDIADAVLEQAQIITRSLPHVQQETAGSNSVSYGQTAVTGVTQRWTDAVERHRLNRGDRT